jgi:hypothetical protein
MLKFQELVTKYKCTTCNIIFTRESDAESCESRHNCKHESTFIGGRGTISLKKQCNGDDCYKIMENIELSVDNIDDQDFLQKVWQTILTFKDESSVPVFHSKYDEEADESQSGEYFDSLK